MQKKLFFAITLYKKLNEFPLGKYIPMLKLRFSLKKIIIVSLRLKEKLEE